MLNYDENGLAIVYHVTSERNLSSILKDGLIPQIGERAKEAEETMPAVYLFPDKDSYDTALAGWLGEFYEDDTISLVILELHVPAEMIQEQPWEYECMAYECIPPEYISNIYDEMYHDISEKSGLPIKKSEAEHSRED